MGFLILCKIDGCLLGDSPEASFSWWIWVDLREWHQKNSRQVFYSAIKHPTIEDEFEFIVCWITKDEEFQSKVAYFMFKYQFD